MKTLNKYRIRDVLDALADLIKDKSTQFPTGTYEEGAWDGIMWVLGLSNRMPLHKPDGENSEQKDS